MNSRIAPVLGLLGLALLSACSTGPSTATATASQPSIALPMRTGWFSEREVHYITTDISDQAVARAQGANYAPRLSAALVNAPQKNVLERVYAFPDASQRPVFQSVPNPLGAESQDTSYSPLWRMVAVAWKPGHPSHELKSEEAILAAEEHGDVTVTVTPIILNCPILSVDGFGTMQGVAPVQR